ncbi:polycomb group protein Psc [Toxorhynchites rutilus septentrionalis]|uniref:polycomb group protein Psc n=1 Tax=Toxorhynchites rutilus septentrionalis TaxID=329112 RepID=UPI00247B1F7E|nr:polycomb group protein Psc [Toxorhynchites rutilus septentrionalis]
MRNNRMTMTGEVAKMTKTTTVVNGPESPYKPSQILLSSVNPCITCNLCKGYLIDATTIVECLHSFCHSCIMKHLRTEQYCPQCEMMINKAKPNIKRDATLQAIVYKLVPSLYEEELHRKRAFYRQHPEKAALATPEQRGEDTEHLIFSPSEKIPLSLEYAEKELAKNNKEFERPKFLRCVAICPIATLKKFIIRKYCIPTHLYYVEIMYKVQTITLPDHYTLMDVAYIYTWKKDAEMKFFYRIRTHEMKSVELPEVPLRRSPSITTSTGRSSSSLALIKEEDTDSKEAHDVVELIKPSDIKREEPSLIECEGGKACTGDAPASETTPTVAIPAAEEGTHTIATSAKSATPVRGEGAGGNDSSPVDVKPNVAMLGNQPQQQHGSQIRGNGGEGKEASISGNNSAVEQPKVKKNESIKLKIEMNKNTYVSILQSPQSDASSKHKSDKVDKVKKKKSEDKDKSVNKIKSTSDLKIKIEKVKDGLVSVKKVGKSSKKVPYKVELNSVSECSKKKNKTTNNEVVESKKAKKDAHKLEKIAKKAKSPKRNPDFDKVQPSIVLKIDQRSPELSTSTLKIVSPLASSSPKHKPELSLEDEKSQFLNSFELTPIKAVQGNGSRSPSTSPRSNSSSPPNSLAQMNTAQGGEGKQGKRKAKEPASGRSLVKKQKLSDDEMKALVERTVQENIKSTSEQISSSAASLKVVKQELESPPPSTNGNLSQSQPLSVKAESALKDPTKQEPKPESFDFKAPIVLPPPVVSTSNIPAPKPAQPVMIAPKPSVEPNKRPIVPSFQKPMQPAKKLPPLLPKEVDHARNNRQKHSLPRGGPQSNPTFNMSHNKDTEISQIKPEDASKKNIKVYGPSSSDNDNFAVPAALSSTSKPKPNKNRPVNYLNYALMNTNKAPAGSRTPIPSYSNSPSYSPDSPQYNPNFNISTKQYKYANPMAYANFLKNMASERKTSNTSPPSLATAAAAATVEKKPEVTKEKKRPCPSPENKQEPPEKQPKLQSLLNQINIPQSLSITLATEEDEAAREKARKTLPDDDKNYIEILKLPEISITEADRSTPPKTVANTQEAATQKQPSAAKSPSLAKADSKPKPDSSAKKSSLEAMDKNAASFHQKFVQFSSVEKEKQPQKQNKNGNKPEKQQQHSPVFASPSSSSPNGGSGTFKLPNATVLSNGIVKLNSYPELDLINKNSVVGQNPRPVVPSPPKAATGGGSKHIPIAPKPTGTYFPPTGTPTALISNRKSMSPPVPRSAGSPGQPKAMTPPMVSSALPQPSPHNALTAMGPMFGLQMKPESSAGYSNYHQPKKAAAEPKPKKAAQKSTKNSNALDLSTPTLALPPAASPSASAMTAADSSKDAMNMLMMNNNLSNAQKAIFLNEMAKLNNSGMMVPQMGLHPLLIPYYLQHWSRMTKAAGSESMEK